MTLDETLAATPGQTVGPFFGYALPFPHDNELVPPGTPGAVRLHGRVLDGDGEPGARRDPGALAGRRRGERRPGARARCVEAPEPMSRASPGFGRASTDGDGHYAFTTVVPGAPFFSVTVLARGLLNRLFTRAYLPGASDALLERLDVDRRSTLLATEDETGYVFDVQLQGDRETVFLTYPRHQR